MACCWGVRHHAWTVTSGLPLSCLLRPHDVVECLWPFSSCILAAYGSDRAIGKAACSLTNANIIMRGWLRVACCWCVGHHAWTVASGLPLSCRLRPHGVVECLWPFSSCISAAYGSDRAIGKAACSLPFAAIMRIYTYLDIQKREGKIPSLFLY